MHICRVRPFLEAGQCTGPVQRVRLGNCPTRTGFSSSQKLGAGLQRERSSLLTYLSFITPFIPTRFRGPFTQKLLRRQITVQLSSATVSMHSYREVRIVKPAEFPLGLTLRS